MKPACKTLVAAAAVVLLTGLAAAADPPDFVDLTPHLEKWFVADGAQKTLIDRLHVVCAGSCDGAALQMREYYHGDTIVRIDRMLFSRDAEGDVLYHGDPLARFETPLVWVDLPLEVGKSWTGDARVGEDVLHYVFAVLEEGTVTCPMGTYPCHHVFVAAVAPDGTVQHENFWYNHGCGLVRCILDGEEGFSLLKAQLMDGPDVPDVLPEDRTNLQDAVSVRGLAAGPNPFNPMTTVRFELAAEAPVTVEIFDLAGHRVRTLARAEVHTPGPCAFLWDGRDGNGRNVASGGYIARVRAGDTTVSERMTLVR